MSNDSTFTPIGNEASRLISRLLKARSVKTHEVNNYTGNEQKRDNDNAPSDWQAARQLSLFDYAVGS
ncbi:MAG: hypothetical protein ACRBBN_13550 [Methyloligellaceae bacterium]